MRESKARRIVLCALFAALTAVFAQITIPIGVVPISLATFAVFCAGALLGSKLGAFSQLAYIALGALGAPVFAMLRGGVNMLVGPTGGYLAGYIIAAWLIGYIVERRGDTAFTLAASMLAGYAAYTLAGTLWFMTVTGSALVPALSVCVLPFIPGDMIKIAAATALAKRLRKALRENTGRNRNRDEQNGL